MGSVGAFSEFPPIAPALAHLGVDQRRQREVIEQVREVLPHVGVAVFPQALVVEAVHLRDLSALVVPSEDCDALSVAYLKAGRARTSAGAASLDLDRAEATAGCR